ncbi:MAG TPA: VOC family protein [Saprospiraceae bacterium]|nr:VOC family protein [Saprospiraceae bacterium]
MSHITPFLWFDQQAEEATQFYISVFGEGSVNQVVRQGDAVIVVNFLLHGQSFSALNGGPQFAFNPAHSFYVICETESEVDRVWERLLDGGSVMMALEEQPWSKKYGFLQDRYGLCWQIAQGSLAETGQKFTPCMLFSGPQSGKGDEAVRRYTSIFPGSTIDGIQYYTDGEGAPVGTVKHAQFKLLDGQTFMIMDNPMDAPYTFNESVSYVVHCLDQAEVDYYWEKLTADGGEESMCGWLKDPYGVSWQIIPEALPKLLGHPDPAVAQRATQAMLKMRKIELDQLT